MSELRRRYTRNPDTVALRPGADAVLGHPPDLFGLPDLRAALVVVVPEQPDVAACLEHWRGTWGRVGRTGTGRVVAND